MVEIERVARPYRRGVREHAYEQVQLSPLAVGHVVFERLQLLEGLLVASELVPQGLAEVGEAPSRNLAAVDDARRHGGEDRNCRGEGVPCDRDDEVDGEEQPGDSAQNSDEVGEEQHAAKHDVGLVRELDQGESLV